MANPFTTAKPALAPAPSSEAQQNYLRALLIKKAQITGMDVGAVEQHLDEWIPTLSKSEAHDEIDKVKEWMDNRPASTEIEDGFYELDGVDSPIRVIHAVHGSGYQYARALDTDTGKWNVKIPGLLQRLAAHGTRIDNDPERAPALGKLYGICMVCGTTLTDKEPGGSIELGIGPVCRARRGW